MKTKSLLTVETLAAKMGFQFFEKESLPLFLITMPPSWIGDISGGWNPYGNLDHAMRLALQYNLQVAISSDGFAINGGNFEKFGLTELSANIRAKMICENICHFLIGRL